MEIQSINLALLFQVPALIQPLNTSAVTFPSPDINQMPNATAGIDLHLISAAFVGSLSEPQWSDLILILNQILTLVEKQDTVMILINSSNNHKRIAHLICSFPVILFFQWPYLDLKTKTWFLLHASLFSYRQAIKLTPDKFS